jgi:CRP/FNR family transcriptional regulator, cyclic AMP receptor protein
MKASPPGLAPSTTSSAPEEFWAALDPALRFELAGMARRRSYARGQALFHRGQLPDRILILVSGRVKVTTATEEGREVVLAFRRPGALIGEQAALDRGARAATVYALEPVEVLSVQVDRFMAFLEQHPAVAVLLLKQLSRRLRESDAQRIEFSRFTTAQRIAARLLEFAEHFGPEALPVSHEELAGATGSSVESVDRGLHTMRSLGGVETGRREIRIVDANVLQRLLGAESEG